MKRLLCLLVVFVLLLSGCSLFDTRPNYKKMSMYDYEAMEYDIDKIVSKNGDIAGMNILGQTADGRNIYEVVVGDINSSEHIIIHGSIHGREYITTKLIMNQLDDFLYQYKCDGEYNGYKYRDLLSGKALHIIPMVNPDGVTISQYGADGIKNQQLKNDVLSMVDSGYDFTQWKANARGVDLNRNFDADWYDFEGAPSPGPDRYKGEYPGSETEADALIRITEGYPVVRTISYHTYGEVIYWYYKQVGQFKDNSESFAYTISDTTGYKVDSNYQALDPAGYKDWAIDKLFIPSLTVEVGHDTNPVPDEQYEEIYNKNKNVWCETLLSLM